MSSIGSLVDGWAFEVDKNFNEDEEQDTSKTENDNTFEFSGGEHGMHECEWWNHPDERLEGFPSRAEGSFKEPRGSQEHEYNDDEGDQTWHDGL